MPPPPDANTVRVDELKRELSHSKRTTTVSGTSWTFAMSHNRDSFGFSPAEVYFWCTQYSYITYMVLVYLNTTATLNVLRYNANVLRGHGLSS